MTDYLEDAAAELRKARNDNEARVGNVMSWLSERDAAVLVEVNDRRMEIAAAFTRLAECQAAMLDAARMPNLLAPAAPKGQDPEDSP